MMVSHLPARSVIVSPPTPLTQPANMGHNYSLMGTGPLVPTYFTSEFTSNGACPNPNILMQPKPSDASQYIQVPPQVYPSYSPTSQTPQVAYLPPRPGSPTRSVSAAASQAEQLRLSLPLSSRVTGPSLPLQQQQPSSPPRGSSSPGMRLHPEVLIGAKQTWEAASAQCSLSEEVKLFLNDIGFVYYQEAFRRGGFEDMETVLAMSQDDMRSLGMLPGHVLKMDMKLDELCKSQGKTRRGKPRMQMHFPWPIPASSPSAALSPTTAAAACLGMSGMMSNRSIAAASNPGVTSAPLLAASPKALQAPMPKQPLALSPVRSRTPSPVENDIRKFDLGAGWTDGRENGVTTVDEESDSRSMGSEIDGEERTSSAPLEGAEGSSERNPSSGSPTSSATFTPHPMRALGSFNTINTLPSGVVALPPRDQHTFGSTCTGLSVRTCPVGTPSGRFGAGQRKMKREELEDLNAKKQANKKVFAWLNQNRFSNVNHERWFLGRGYYPLHAAVRENNVEMIKLLLSLKADPARKNSGGQTPLEYAQAKQRTSVICDMLQEWQG
mmetsp:Transcript_53897/g.126394  ORF Transcript_53897/g.126394 Transcript_53897/m.126394 type:complete len:553 (+) Transcript_53897:47-1705(+)